MSTDNVISFGKPKAPPPSTPEPAQVRHSCEPTDVPGLWKAFVDLDLENIDKLGDLAGEFINKSPGDLILVFGGEVLVQASKDFDVFQSFTNTMFDNIYNDVVMGHLFDLHDGLPEDTKLVYGTEISSFLCRVKHAVGTGVRPLASLVIQISVNTFGMMVNLVYGHPTNGMYDHTPLFTFTFKPKVD